MLAELRKNGQRERGSLAGAGLGAADDIASGEHERNAAELDGRGRDVTRRTDPFDNRRERPNFMKGMGCRLAVRWIKESKDFVWRGELHARICTGQKSGTRVTRPSDYYEGVVPVSAFGSTAGAMAGSLAGAPAGDSTDGGVSTAASAAGSVAGTGASVGGGISDAGSTAGSGSDAGISASVKTGISADGSTVVAATSPSAAGFSPVDFFSGSRLGEASGAAWVGGRGAGFFAVSIRPSANSRTWP